LKPALDASELFLLPAFELALKQLLGFPVGGPLIAVLARVGFVVVEQCGVGATMMD
jgi:hypothetical protein